MKTSNKLISAILTLALGVLFIVLQGRVISIAMTVFGAALLISAVFDLINKNVTSAVVKGVIGVCIIVFGWTLVSVALYVLAAILLVFGILELYNMSKMNVRGVNKWQTVLCYAEPVFKLIAGVCLLFNQGGTITWIFILTGILLVIEGVIALVACFENK